MLVMGVTGSGRTIMLTLDVQLSTANPRGPLQWLDSSTLDIQ